MPVQTILQLGDPLLRERCHSVDARSESTAKTVQDLADTLAATRAATGYGRAIAAPQIGSLERVIFLNVEKPWPLVNPVISSRGDETVVVWDACLSFLEIFMQVRRHKFITVHYEDLAGNAHEFHAGPDNDYAELLQHEIDHLDGMLCIDRVEDVKTIVTKSEFEKRYKAQSPYARAVTPG